MAQRLKVFITSDGLTDYVVAVSSRAKALAAWGVRQDVFKEGQAHETDDPALVRAAMAEPGKVLRKPAGTRGSLAKLRPVKAAKPAGPTKAELKRVADLEGKLAALQADHDRQTAAVLAEREALDARSKGIEARYETNKARLEASLRTARAALE